MIAYFAHLLLGAVWSWCPSILTTIILYFVTSLLWRVYVLRTAHDPKSEVPQSVPLPPGEFGLPLIGETLDWAREGSVFVSKRREKYGNIFSTHMLGEPVIRVTGADNFKQLMAGEHKTITSKMPKSARALLGTNTIVQSSGEAHKKRRASVLRAFSHSALESYIPIITQIMQSQMKKWTNKSTHVVYKDLKAMTSDLAFKIFLGLEISDPKIHENISKNVEIFMTNLFSMPFESLGLGFKKGMDARKRIHALLDEHIANKRDLYENDECAENKITDALQYIIAEECNERRRRKIGDESDCSDLIDDRTSEFDGFLTCAEIREICVEFLTAGTQTTSGAMTCLLHELAQHPDVVRKLEEELSMNGLLHVNTKSSIHDDEAYLSDEEFENNDLNLRTLNRLKYLDQVVKETLRIHSPIPGMYRTALKTFQLGEYRIPKGWTILFNLRDTHDSEWEENNKFNPERFSDPAMLKGEDKYKWLPFSRGKRQCVAKEYSQMACKIFLIQVMKKFKTWTFANGKPSKMTIIPVHHPADGMPMNFEER